MKLLISFLLISGCSTFQTVGAFWFFSWPTTTTSCGSQTNQPRLDTKIVGGIESSPNSWPWQAALLKQNQFQLASLVCGASLINNRWLLTAAHCVESHKNSPQSLKIFLGAHKLTVIEATRQLFSVTKVIVHPNYNTFGTAATQTNDIALIKLSSSVTFNSYISPVCLPSATHSCPSDGQRGYVTGWGTTTADGLPSSSLRQVSLPVVNRNSCQTSYSRVNESIATGGQQFCAGYTAGGMDSCQGDSGGPFVMKEIGKWYQQGIVSWGYSCALPNFPGVYTCVSHYRNWIDQQISIN